MKEFIENLAEQFDDVELAELKEDTQFKELEDWSSLTVMGIIAMAKTIYGKKITGREVRSCDTVKDLYQLITSK